MKNSTFTVLGVPLQSSFPLQEKSSRILESCDLIIGESRKSAQRWLSKAQLKKDVVVFFLDNLPDREHRELEQNLKSLKHQGGNVCLFSDTGMPILFDPGKQILEIAKSLGFEIHCEPGPTSWGTACAMSGWSPPFLVVGFLPPKTQERQSALKDFISSSHHVVLMDTPYRFQQLLKDCRDTLGAERQAFLAWEIGGTQEHYFWGSLKELDLAAQKKHWQKGEFILILQQASVK